MGYLCYTTAVVLAGGLGTRLRSVVSDRPKVLAETCGKPFLSHILDRLKVAGISEAVICTGYLGEQVEAAYKGSYGGLRLSYSRESTPQGTAGALRSALPLLGSDPVLVMNGDSLFQADLGELFERHRRLGARATLALAHRPDTHRFGQVTIAEDGRVTVFEEKGSRHGPGWINAGIYVIGRELLASIPAAGAVSLERECFPAWIGRGLYGDPVEGRFLDIGTPESYAAASEFFAAGEGSP